MRRRIAEMLPDIRKYNYSRSPAKPSHTYIGLAYLVSTLVLPAFLPCCQRLFGLADVDGTVGKEVHFTRKVEARRGPIFQGGWCTWPGGHNNYGHHTLYHTSSHRTTWAPV